MKPLNSNKANPMVSLSLSCTTFSLSLTNLLLSLSRIFPSLPSLSQPPFILIIPLFLFLSHSSLVRSKTGNGVGFERVWSCIRRSNLSQFKAPQRCRWFSGFIEIRYFHISLVLDKIDSLDLHIYRHFVWLQWPWLINSFIVFFILVFFKILYLILRKEWSWKP